MSVLLSVEGVSAHNVGVRPGTAGAGTATREAITAAVPLGNHPHRSLVSHPPPVTAGL